MAHGRNNLSSIFVKEWHYNDSDPTTQVCQFFKDMVIGDYQLYDFSCLFI